MEVEAETCQSNDTKNEKESSEKLSPDENTETAKADQKQSPNRKSLRSRSKTPQKKAEEAKTLQISLQKMEVELNGKDLVEENEKTEEKSITEGDKFKADEVIETNGTEKVEEKIEESPALEKLETESTKSATSTPKKRTSPRNEASPKNVDNFKKPEEVDAEKDSVEMDPLVITDEADPELQFDENSDMESGKGSPVIQRCVTRRSQTRNIPTPKTPKIPDQVELDQESEKVITPVEEAEVEVQKEVLLKSNIWNETSDSTDMINVSTKVQVGSDTTRLEYTDRNVTVPEDTSYLDASRERSLTETLRCLSARRPIRPTDNYRRTLLKSTQQRSDLNQPQDPVDRVTTGVKRKDRSSTPEETKKFRSDSPGRGSLFSSPFTNIRSRFKSDLPSSTPKLLGYRDAERSLHCPEDLQLADRNGVDEKNSWCAIM